MVIKPQFVYVKFFKCKSIIAVNLSYYGVTSISFLFYVTQMFVYIINEYLENIRAKIDPLVETPSLGLLHPKYKKGYFESPKAYLDWYKREGPLANKTGAPTVGILLFRKHVITE